jgi:PAS domain S-box-containing protein
MHFISVVIPCYRQAHFLGEAIESVLAQTHGRYEIVVVDDGSPDNTQAVARQYPGVRYLQQENRGVSAARNSGLAVAKGEYVVFLDADDRLLPNHFDVSLRAFRERPDAAFVAGNYRWFGAEGTWHVHDCAPRPNHYASLLRSNFIGPPHAVMFRRSVLQEIGGFRGDLKAFEDLELFLRLARSYPMYCHHEVVALYRRHDGQISMNRDAMLRAGISVLKAQRRLVGHPLYREAYRAGIRHTRRTWGMPLVWDMVAALRARSLRRAACYLAILVCFYPQGLLELLRQKLIVVRRRQPEHRAILVRALDGSIWSCNGDMEPLYGWRPEEVIGKSSHRLLQTVFPMPLDRIQAQLLESGCWEGTLVHTRRDGLRLAVTSRWELVESGAPTILETNRPLTHREGLRQVQLLQ